MELVPRALTNSDSPCPGRPQALSGGVQHERALSRRPRGTGDGESTIVLLRGAERLAGRSAIAYPVGVNLTKQQFVSVRDHPG